MAFARATRKWALTAAIAMVLSAAGTARAGETKTAPEFVLPGDVIVHGVGAPLKSMSGDIKSLIKALGKSLPIPGAHNPDILEMGFWQNSLGLSKEMLDETRGVEVVLCLPQMPGAEPVGAILLPVSSVKKFADLLGQGGGDAVKKLDDGGFQLNLPGKPTRFAYPVGDTLIAFGPNKDKAAQVSRAAVGLDRNGPSGKPGSALAMFTVDIAKIVTTNGPIIDMAFQQAEMQMAMSAKADTAPPFAEALAKVAPPYLQTVRQMLDQLKSVRTYAYADGDRIRLSGFVTPQEGTPMRDFADAYGDADPKYDMVKYMPEKPGLLYAGNIEKKAIQPILPWVNKLVVDMCAAFEFKDADKLVEATDKIMALTGGDIVLAMTPSGDNGGPAIVQAFQVADSAAYMKLQADNIRLSKDLVNMISSAVGMEDMADKIDVRYVEDAGKVEGIPYSEFNFIVPEGDGKAAAGGTPDPNQILLNALGKQDHRFAAVDEKTVLTGQGMNVDKAFADLIKAFKAKQSRLGKDKTLMDAMDAESSKQIGFVAMYFLDMFKMQKARASGMMPGNQGAKMANAMKMVPPSTVPMTAAFGAQSGSLKFSFRVPTAAVTETAMAMMTFSMMMNAGGTPPQPPANVPEGEEF